MISDPPPDVYRPNDLFVPLGPTDVPVVITIAVMLPITVLFLGIRLWLLRRVKRSWLLPENICLLIGTFLLFPMAAGRIVVCMTGVYFEGHARLENA